MEMFPAMMVDMKKSPEEIAEELAPSTSPNPEYIDKYPYGLCICLDEDSMAKLGLDGTCEVDDGVQIIAYAKVTSVSSRENVSAESPSRRVELQITHMALGPDHYMSEGESNAA